MSDVDSTTLSVVVALPDPVAAGTTISRREWPAHVTLASNFVVDAPQAVLERAVRDLCDGETALPIRFGDDARFGLDHSVPVQLVESDRIVALHMRLADLLETMPGFAATEPAFWRKGYRPHMTHVPGVPTPPGARGLLPFIAIAELTAARAVITATITLPGAPAVLDPQD